MNKKYRVVIVEDEDDIRTMVSEELEKQNYTVFTVKDGQEAERLFEKNPPFDLVLLDLMLPKKDGYAVLSTIRKISNVPVLILSAKDSEFDKIIGLENGADDYLTKPFSLLELQARIRAILRRNDDYRIPQKAHSSKSIKIQDLVLYPEEFLVRKKTEDILLTNKEFRLLKVLAENPQKVFTKYQLYKQVWDDEFLNAENVLNVTVRRVRQKIEEDPSNPKIILTVWGIGYKLGVEK